MTCMVRISINEKAKREPNKVYVLINIRKMLYSMKKNVQLFSLAAGQSG